jgi:hypothetical protein
VNRLVLAGLLGLAAIVTGAMLVTARQPAGLGDTDAAFVLPDRSSPPPPPAPTVPAVPAAAESLAPITYTLVTTWDGVAGGRRRIEQQVTRTRDRALLIVDDGTREWYFERNPVHPGRVSGWLVDHEARRILAHDESSLRTMLRIRGWIDVLTMRFDPAALEGLADTGTERTVAGETFHLFRASPQPPTGVVEVWWSDGLQLPLELVTRESADVTATARVLGLTTDVDMSVLASPQQRFPGYRVMDAVDAGEHR